jgi:hypothetical protein
MPNNQVLLEKIVVGAAGASSVTFSGIPQTGYTDLCLKLSPRGSTTAGVMLSINSSSSSFSYRLLIGDSSSVSSSNNTTGRIGSVVSTTSNTFSNMEIYFPNYAGSTNKSYSVDAVSEANATTAYTEILQQSLHLPLQYLGTPSSKAQPFTYTA